MTPSLCRLLPCPCALAALSAATGTSWHPDMLHHRWRRAGAVDGLFLRGKDPTSNGDVVAPENVSVIPRCPRTLPQIRDGCKQLFESIEALVAQAPTLRALSYGQTTYHMLADIARQLNKMSLADAAQATSLTLSAVSSAQELTEDVNIATGDSAAAVDDEAEDEPFDAAVSSAMEAFADLEEALQLAGTI